MELYPPEGLLLDSGSNRSLTATAAGLSAAAECGAVLEGVVTLCDTAHNLHVALPAMSGIIPREEGAVGIADGSTRDIALLSRVGKPVCFVVTGFRQTADGAPQVVLSRRLAQEQCQLKYLLQLRAGDIIPARVTRLEAFGVFCDIGCGLAALLPIAGLSVSRIAHPADRVAVGEMLRTVVTSTADGRICLSQRELLGTWEQNAAQFAAGETVSGMVRSVEGYGVFVELTPNLAGLAEPNTQARAGQLATVYIKSILPDKMKMKLVLIDTQDPPSAHPPLHYFISEGHLDRWVYSPAGCTRFIGTEFTETP